MISKLHMYDHAGFPVSFSRSCVSGIQLLSTAVVFWFRPVKKPCFVGLGIHGPNISNKKFEFAKPHKSNRLFGHF